MPRARRLSENEHNGACGDEASADENFSGDRLAENRECEDHREDDAEFVDGRDLAYVADLKRFEVAQPGKPRRYSGENEEYPGTLRDVRDPAVSAGHKDDSPGENEHDCGADGCREVGIDAFDADFRKDGSECRECRGCEGESNPHGVE